MIVILSLLLLLLPLSAYASSPDEAWNAYLSGNFEMVDVLVTVALDDTTLSDKQMARLYLALGCADGMRGLNTAAITAFERALTLDPTIEMTSSDLPPPVWKLFQPVRQRMPRSRPMSNRQLNSKDTVVTRGPAARIDTLYIPLYRSKSTVVKSFLFPGWGHLTEERQRGWLYIGVEAVMISGWIISAIKADQARQAYLRATEQQLISDRYDRYNLYYRLSWGFAIGAVATYLIAQVDFFTGSPAEASLHITSSQSPSFPRALTLFIGFSYPCE